MHPTVAASGRRGSILAVAGSAGLLIFAAIASISAVSSAASTMTAATKTVASPAVIRALDLPAAAPPHRQGMRAVSLSARTNRGLGELDTMVPGPSLLHRVPSPVPHRVSGPNPHAAVQNAPLFSTNWSGQVLAGGTYTGVGGQWTVPAVQPSGGAQYSATW